MPAFATIVVAVALALAPAALAQSQPFPARPIKLVIPQPSGGHSDVIGRIIGPKLAEILQQPVVIDNRGGAGGTIGAELVARAPHDGYTLLLGGSNNLSIAVTMTGEARYDPVRDFAPIGGVAVVPYALAVRTGVPATTLTELLAYRARIRAGSTMARVASAARPASPSNGSSPRRASISSTSRIASRRRPYWRY